MDPKQWCSTELLVALGGGKGMLWTNVIYHGNTPEHFGLQEEKKIGKEL